MKTRDVKKFLSPRQRKVASFVENDKYFMLCEGAFRSGKTFIISFYFFFFTQLLKRGYHHLVLGKNRGIIEAEILPKFKLLAAICRVSYHYTRYDGTLTMGRQIYHIIAGNDDRDKDRLYGYTMHSMLCTEVTRVPEEFFKAATTRLTFEGGKIFADCNPENPQHWVKVDWIDTGIVDVREHFTFEDNPILSEAKKEQFRKQYAGVFARRMVDGVWAQADGLIYPVFTEGGGRGRPERVDLGVDYGSSSPSALVELHTFPDVAIVASSKRLDASPANNRTDASLADEIEVKAWDCGASSIILDPSAVSLRAELRKRKAAAKPSKGSLRGISGVRPWAIVKAKNDLVPGIRFCSSQLEHGGILVAPGDVNKDWRREQQNYSWDEEQEDTPIEVNAHTLAAFRYVAYTRLGRLKGRGRKKPRGI